MPYCSIEEAWGKDFFDNEAEPEKFKKIVSDDYYNDEDYFNNNYKDSNVYNELGDNLFCPENKLNKIKKKKKKKNFQEPIIDYLSIVDQKQDYLI